MTVSRALLLLLLPVTLAVCACHRADRATVPVSSAANSPVSGADESTRAAVRFLEERVKADPDDFVALNKLSGYYLQLHRQTEDVNYLRRALETARQSAGLFPADQNLGGLQALATAEFETHDFAKARDHARELVQYQKSQAYGQQLLGDALLELGDYDGASAAYAQLEKLEPETVGTESRLARMAFLKGDIGAARRHYEFALTQAKKSSLPSAETIAWCDWQLGELSFLTGDYANAEKYYRRALEILPGYSHAQASLAKARAAQGATAEAILLYEQMLKSREDALDEIALADLYKVSGRSTEAATLYDKAERWMKTDELTTRLFSRHLILFLADHDLKSDEAYRLARKNYDDRPDVYGADALAWAAFKAGRVEEAKAAMNDSLRLGTKDARLFYHAGMILLAAGDTNSGKDFLQRALALNPQFCPLQSSMARNALVRAANAPAKTS